MKHWRKVTGFALFLILAAVCLFYLCYTPKVCRLCHMAASDRFCAVDIMTGETEQLPYVKPEKGCGVTAELKKTGGGIVNPFLFCRQCRGLLPTVSECRVVLAALRQPRQPVIFPLKSGAVYTSDPYRITVERGQSGKYSITVTVDTPKN